MTKPILAEPVKVAEFWKNRKGETIRATLVAYEGRVCFDLRQHFTAHDGRMQPTRKGIAKAIELGLIEAEGTQ